MKLQVIKSVEGKTEYVLLPVGIYNELRLEIKEKMKSASDYIVFDVADYVENPVALARINACMTQEELAKRMNVTQAYISKIECQDRVTAKLLKRVEDALAKIRKKAA